MDCSPRAPVSAGFSRQESRNGVPCLLQCTPVGGPFSGKNSLQAGERTAPLLAVVNFPPAEAPALSGVSSPGGFTCTEEESLLNWAWGSCKPLLKKSLCSLLSPSGGLQPRGHPWSLGVPWCDQRDVQEPSVEMRISESHHCSQCVLTVPPARIRQKNIRLSSLVSH